MAKPISGATRIAALIGSPVAHSGSPAIHNAAYDALGIDARYVAFEVGVDQVESALDGVRDLGWLGLNVTMPLKQRVAELVDELSPQAAALNSCNCVYLKDGKVVGDSTDGPGLVRSIEASFAGRLTGATVAVVGAGGAARSIVDALGRSGVESIAVVNRTIENAEVAAELSDLAHVGESSEIASAEVVINTSSVGMAETAAADGTPFDTALLNDSQLVVDIVYNPRVTPLLSQADAAGCDTLGGIGMLVHQAAISFELWTGQNAPIQAMAEAVGA